MTGQLCLKWNNHSSAFNKLLGKIFLEDEYSDGTILCQGKFYPVHRFVLSTCSEYFEEVFKHCVRLNNKHPIIIVKDINPSQMEALLNYMYKGEVNVPQEMLPELIKAAEAFKIKGLAVPDEDEDTPRRKRRTSGTISPQSHKKSRKQEDRSVTDEETTRESLEISSNLPESKEKEDDEIFITEPPICEIKSEPEESRGQSDEKNERDSSSFKNEEDFESYSNDGSNYEAFDFDPSNPTDRNFDSLEGTSTSWDNSQAFDENAGNASEQDPTQNMLHAETSESGESDLPYRCTSCNYATYHSFNLKRHRKIHTKEKPFSCPQCPYRAALKHHVEYHVKAIHLKDKPFKCSYCDYKSTNKNNLTMHLYNKHRAYV